MINATEYVASLIERARKAQEIAEGFSQERVDHLIKLSGFTIFHTIARKE